MPQLYMIGGPNGAGKTTTAMELLPENLDCLEYVNADAIATGLSPFKPSEVSIQAGKLMLKRIKSLIEQQEDFAFETTMASRSFASLLRAAKKEGYDIHLLFVWVRDVELSVKRVEKRVEDGGHSVPEDAIRRRYKRGLANFFELYMQLADSWALYDNSSIKPSLIGEFVQKKVIIKNNEAWELIEKVARCQ